MPRYHVEIVDGYRIEDPVGLDCTSDQQARQVAEDIARQIVVDVGAKAARKVVVVDDEGSQVYVAPIKT